MVTYINHMLLNVLYDLQPTFSRFLILNQRKQPIITSIKPFNWFKVHTIYVDICLKYLDNLCSCSSHSEQGESNYTPLVDK